MSRSDEELEPSALARQRTDSSAASGDSHVSSTPSPRVSPILDALAAAAAAAAAAAPAPAPASASSSSSPPGGRKRLRPPAAISESRSDQAAQPPSDLVPPAKRGRWLSSCMLWRLPDRLLLLIVAEWVLDPFDLSTVSNLALVCRAAADIVASDHVWKRLYERRWPLHAALNVPRVNGGANGANGADKGLVGGGSAGPLSPRSAASGASESAAAASATIASASVVTAGAAASAAAAAPSSAFSARSASTASGVAESSPHRELFKTCYLRRCVSCDTPDETHRYFTSAFLCVPCWEQHNPQVMLAKQQSKKVFLLNEKDLAALQHAMVNRRPAPVYYFLTKDLVAKSIAKFGSIAALRREKQRRLSNRRKKQESSQQRRRAELEAALHAQGIDDKDISPRWRFACEGFVHGYDKKTSAEELARNILKDLQSRVIGAPSLPAAKPNGPSSPLAVSVAAGAVAAPPPLLLSSPKHQLRSSSASSLLAAPADAAAVSASPQSVAALGASSAIIAPSSSSIS